MEKHLVKLCIDRYGRWSLGLLSLWMSSFKETSNIVFDLLQQSILR